MIFHIHNIDNHNYFIKEMSELKKSDADVVKKEILHSIRVVPFYLYCKPDFFFTETLSN